MEGTHPAKPTCLEVIETTMRPREASALVCRRMGSDHACKQTGHLSSGQCALAALKFATVRCPQCLLNFADSLTSIQGRLPLFGRCNDHRASVSRLLHAPIDGPQIANQASRQSLIRGHQDLQSHAGRLLVKTVMINVRIERRARLQGSAWEIEHDQWTIRVKFCGARRRL